MADGAKPRRTRVERGIYRQANGNYASAPAAPVGFTSAPPALTWAQRDAPVRI
jgi:hypothetical protein